MLGRSELSKDLIHPWRRLLLGVNELCAHVVGVIVILASMWLIEFALHVAWPHRDLVLFEGLPYLECKVVWFFDAAEVGILISFGLRSVFTIQKALAK